MKVYKCYYIWNDEKIYLERRDGTNIFVSLRGLKASITQREKDKRWYQGEKYKEDKYYIETYNAEFEKVEEV